MFCVGGFQLHRFTRIFSNLSFSIYILLSDFFMRRIRLSSMLSCFILISLFNLAMIVLSLFLNCAFMLVLYLLLCELLNACFTHIVFHTFLVVLRQLRLSLLFPFLSFLLSFHTCFSFFIVEKFTSFTLIFMAWNDVLFILVHTQPLHSNLNICLYYDILERQLLCS